MSPADAFIVLVEIARWTCLVTLAVAVVATLLAETTWAPWYARVCDFPRSQVAVAALLTGFAVPLLHLVFRGTLTFLDGMALLLGLLVVVRQAFWIWPYMPFAARDVNDAENPPDENVLRLIVSNVLQPNEDHDLWRRVMSDEDADVFALAEADQTWIDAANELIGQSHPHHVHVPLDNLYGMAVWSRLPTSDVSVEYTVQEDIPSVHMTVELASGQKVRVHVVHPRPPAPQESDSSAPRDAELVLLGRRISEAEEGPDALPTVVCGDLNDVAWSRTTDLFLRLSGLLDTRRGRGLYNTFHAGHWWVRFPLDHVFAGRAFKLVEMRRLDYVGSDHFPILVCVAYDDTAEAEQPAHERDESTEEEASDRVDEQLDREADDNDAGHLRHDRKAVQDKD